ncbi:MAG: signal peptide peptidase SppA [Firmicutes bacterium]|nr:signal peptide peptidase SppA [Bacillota bacterium]
MRWERGLVLFAVLAVLVWTLVAVFVPGAGPGLASRAGGVPVIAVVNLEGPLVAGSGTSASLLDPATSSADAICAILSDIREDPGVAAVVLRVNSEGSTVAAAQEVADELLRVREAGKVVVTSLGDIGASGAYWIACATDHIVANPGTITGSIGVIWEFANYAELYRKLGLRYTTFTSGPYKDMGNPSRDLTAEERRMVEEMIADMYEQFVQAVVQGRNMSRQAVLKLADGRVFTGSQAYELGLVDSLGGLGRAVDKAVELAGIEGEYQLREYGRPSPWELLLSELWALARYLRLAGAAAYGAYGTAGSGAGGRLLPGEGP